MKAKKIISIIATVILSVGLFAGCGSKEETSKKNEGPAVLTVLMDQTDGWVRNFNPYAATVYQFTQGFVYEPLVIYDTANSNKETMWLAEDVISEPDNKTLTVKLKKDVKWSDGEAFNADDVVFTYTYSKDHTEIDKNGDWGDKGKIESVQKVDDYTVKIVMKTENQFHRFDIFKDKWIVPEHIWSKISDPSTYVQETPVATGAFTEVKSFESEMVVLAKNPNYWNAKNLQVDELKVPQFNGNDGALALLESGSVDWAHIFIPNIDTTYVKGDKHKKYWYGQNDGVRLSFNYMTPNEGNKKAFSDVNFRRAVSLSVDREYINESAVFGYLDAPVPTVTGLPPALYGYRNTEADKLQEPFTKFDVEEAKKILDKAGFVDKNGDGFRDNPDGSAIKFDIVSPAGWSDWNAGAVIVADGLQKAGINASANAKDLSVIMESWKAGDFDMLYTANGQATNIWKYYFDTIGDQSRFKTDTWWSTCQNNYQNNELTALIAELPKADEAKTKEIIAKIEKFYSENMINVPVLYNGNWFVYNDGRFTGWTTKGESGPNPALSMNDSKILQLMNLKPVK